MEHQFYNAETKIWSAPSNGSTYNPDSGVGDIIFNKLTRNAAKTGQICADTDAELTFGALREMSIRVAVNLKKLGYKAGDQVTIAGRNNAEIAAVVFGSLFIGAPVNFLDPDFEKDDFVAMFSAMKPKLVVCEQSCHGHVKAALLERSLTPTTPVIMFGESLSLTLLKKINFDYDNFTPEKIVDCASTAAWILCSASSSGPPKGVAISHSQINAQLIEAWPVVDTDIVLAFSSLYYASGFITLLIGTVAGAKRVITEKPFSPELQIELIEKYKISFMFSPPSDMVAMLGSIVINDADLTSVRFCCTGGSSVSEKLRSNFESKLPNGIVRYGYGRSEISVVTMSLLRHKPDSVGQLKGRVSVKIIDEDGKSRGPNEQGQIIVKTPYPFIEYLCNSDKVRQVIDPEGWLYTGDIGYFDDDAFLFIVGRSKETIKFRGIKIFPEDLEAFLQKETDIKQVCVFGIKSHRQDLLAAVLLKTDDCKMTLEEIKELCDEKLPDHKRFRGGIYFVDKFPLTSTGKIKRLEVKQFIEQNLRAKSKAKKNTLNNSKINGND